MIHAGARILTDIDNERTKLLAGSLDRLAAVAFGIGLLFPAAAYVYSAFDLNYPYADTRWHVVGLLGWPVLCVFLHLMARRVLGSLK